MSTNKYDLVFVNGVIPNKIPKNIFEYRHSIQNVEHYDPIYKGISRRMRSILVNWLHSISILLKLTSDTQFLAVKILDQHLSNTSAVINNNNIQLIGMAASFISSKLCEVYPPEIRDYIYMSKYTYNRTELLDMEKSILVSMGSYLIRPTIIDFIRYNSNALDLDIETHKLSQTIAKLTIENVDSSVRASEIAAVSTYLAMHSKNIVVDEIIFKLCTKLDIDTIRELIIFMYTISYEIGNHIELSKVIDFMIFVELNDMGYVSQFHEINREEIVEQNILHNSVNIRIVNDIRKEYKFINILGSGTYGDVRSAIKISDSTSVAVKKSYINMCNNDDNEGISDSFLREISIMSKYSTTLIDVMIGQSEYIVMKAETRDLSCIE